MIDKNQNIYKDIINLLINILKKTNLKIKIVKDNEFYEHFFRLVAHLLFLEKEYHAHYEHNMYSKNFAQVLADLRNEEIKIIKEDNLTLEMIKNDFNFLQTYALNIFQVTKKELNHPQEISLKIFEELAEINNSELVGEFQTNNIGTNNQSNNFVQDQHQAAIEKNSQLIENNINVVIDNQNDDNIKAMDIAQNLQSLKLPTHPAHNQGFYPYTTKSNLIPIYKNILAYAFIILLLFTIGISIYGFVTTIEIDIIRKNLVKSEKIMVQPAGIGWNLSVWNIILELFLYAILIYVLFKKPQFLRDKYRLHPMLLVVTFTIIFFNSIYGTYGFLSYNSFVQFFSKAFSEIENYEEVLKTIWDNFQFQMYRVLKLVSAGLALIPIILILFIFSINPRLDRDKLMHADLEYQKALQAALKGQQYTIDITLFDQDLILESEKNEEQKKVHDL